MPDISLRVLSSFIEPAKIEKIRILLRTHGGSPAIFPCFLVCAISGECENFLYEFFKIFYVVKSIHLPMAMAECQGL